MIISRKQTFLIFSGFVLIILMIFPGEADQCFRPLGKAPTWPSSFPLCQLTSTTSIIPPTSQIVSTVPIPTAAAASTTTNFPAAKPSSSRTISLARATFSQPPALARTNPLDPSPEETFFRLDLAGEWEFRQVGQKKWRPARVPGCVHLDLQRQGLIPDPFYRDNELKVQWVEEKDWEYRREFHLASLPSPENKVELVFEGLDTLATIFLNGTRVGQTANMFRLYRFDVTSLLRKGPNSLRIVFTSPVKREQELAARKNYRLPGNAPHIRKAPYHFGWDWGPRLVTSGIWRPVYLESWRAGRLESFNYHLKSFTSKKARLEIEVEVRGQQSFQGRLEVTLSGETVIKKEIPVAIHAGLNCLSLPLEVSEPRLWWPNGLGEPYLYRLELALYKGEKCLHRLDRRIGLRTLRVVRQPDQWGRSFYFEVNGRPLFAKGGNWIPADSFPPRVTPQKYRRLLTACTAANMNMIRVWGGGIYEADVFYDLCDELGLLVWQDFMFACALYPGDDEFLANVRQEVEDQVRRLRYHPCLALWCGNNECEEGWFHWGWQKNLPASVWDDYEKLFHELIPGVIEQLDPGRTYWPSSPHSEEVGQPRAAASGDMHYWGIWHGREPFTNYQKLTHRFFSEFGFQSFPCWSTIKSFARPEDWNIASPVMEQHQKHPIGNKLIVSYLLDHFRLPSKFNDLVWLSQVLQAEGMKMAVEHFRSQRPRTMGALYWQLNDCWPVVSWSGLDYYGRWKALHYFARRFYAPLLLALIRRGDDLVAYGISDQRHPFSGELQLRLLSYQGETLWQTTLTVTVPPDKSVELWRRSLDDVLSRHQPNEVYLVGRLLRRSEERSPKRAKIGNNNSLFPGLFRPGEISRQLYHFSPLKRVDLPHPRIDVSIQKAEKGLFQLELTADKLAKYVFLQVPGIEGGFSDNFFDLLPGEKRRVYFLPAQSLSLADFKASLQVKSLRDTY
jgi:beta-mannosidase